MMDVYREILPDSYLLILMATVNAHEAAGLQHALHRAGTSGKASVWVDCSGVPLFSAATLRVLSEAHSRLQRRGIPLVLCHLTAPALEALQQLPALQRPPVVATLLEAATYCRSQFGRRARLTQPRPTR